MKPDRFLAQIVDPTLRSLAAWPFIAIKVSDEARVLVLAIAGQESGWTARRQVGGPARGYWQFEQGGGVAGLFGTMGRQLSAVCGSLDITFDPATVFEAMAWNDTLACAMARFLLWVDPLPLPALGEADEAWAYYERNWRPGAPHPEAWKDRYSTALTLVTSVAKAAA